MLKQGNLFYVRDEENLAPVHVVNILLSTVRPKAAELDYCFDLISPNKRVYTLQAETEGHYDQLCMLTIILLYACFVSFLYACVYCICVV